MAKRQPIVDAMHAFVCQEDMSLNRYHIVRISCYSARWNGPMIALCGDGQKMCGILQDNPPQWDFGNVMRAGKSPCVISTAIACAISWASDANGHAVAAVAEDWIGGQMHEPGTLSPTPTGNEKGTLDVEALNPWRAYPTWTE